MIKGFKMRVYPGMEEEYERRHNLLWPEMKEMIHEYGGKNYSIFLDPETHVLYGYIELEDEEKWGERCRYCHQPQVVGLYGRYYGYP